MATHFSILSWRIPMDRGPWWTIVHGITESQTQLSDFHFHFEASLMAQTVKNLPAMLEDLGSMLNIALYAIQWVLVVYSILN